jgi:hypothetical protein
MAHYKETEKGQGLFLTVNLSEQLVPGTFEHTLNKLIDKKLDLSIFDNKYNYDGKAEKRGIMEGWMDGWK